MREIKFRAWFKKQKKLSSPFLLELMSNALQIGMIEENVVLQQFTGLHDKNGKEIYEGDIVRYSIEGDMQDEPIEVDMFNLREGLNEGDHYMRIDGDSITVIGNIYETPGLLN